MQNKRVSLWAEGLVINLVSNAAAFTVGCIVAYLKHEGSEWVSPLLFGAMAWLMTMGILIAIRLLRSIPSRQVKVTDKTLPLVLRGWLDNIGLKVQSLKDESWDFKYVVTTDGKWVIAIARLHETPESLTFTGYYQDEGQNFSHFTNSEKIEIRLAIRLELSRAVIGYTSQDFLDGFTLFKRIPITPQLSVEQVSETLWEVEAALASVFIIGAGFLAKKKQVDLSLHEETDKA